MSSTILDPNLRSSSLPIQTDSLVIAEPVTPPFSVRKFSVAEYQLLGQYNILDEDDNVELLEGWICEKMTKNPQHTLVLENLFWALHRRLPAGFYVRNQEPITTSDSVPEPDLAVVRGNRLDYGERHPDASEVLLVIEVADSSLRKDRRKAAIYARAGINQYWIVNLTDRCVETFSNPITTEPARYVDEVVVSINDNATIRLTENQGITIPVSDFLIK